MKFKPWTIALIILVAADSALTVHIGAERNPVILWAMDTFDLSLKAAMLARLIYLFPLIVFINYKDLCKLTFLAYLSIYIICLFF
ncbi:MAG: hypothetical protein KAS39_04525 [Actinomycetia bacterium]|nr:hypothetical protein [Actinomycetes bacterium]